MLTLLDRKSNKEVFKAEVKRLVEGLGKVGADSKKVTLEIRDLDYLATVKEVKSEVRRAHTECADKLRGEGLEP